MRFPLPKSKNLSAIPRRKNLRTGDATGYHCATHGDFKVADTVFAEDKAKDYTREQWEDALNKATLRAEPDEWPLIITDDFF
jgi:hypothetical protein